VGVGVNVTVGVDVIVGVGVPVGSRAFGVAVGRGKVVAGTQEARVTASRLKVQRKHIGEYRLEVIGRILPEKNFAKVQNLRKVIRITRCSHL
jgi:hypothetical protein